MFGTHHLALFVLAGIMLNITPGPDSILVMSRTGAQGWRAGSVAALGIGTGTLVHILAAALGLSALLSTSAMAFAVIKYLGAAYLLYMGVSMMMQRAKKSTENNPESTSNAPQFPLALANYRKIFLQGLLTNVLNPKVALFFLAFVPQFISADAQNKALAFVVLGLIFNVNAMLWCHLLVLFTALVRRKVAMHAGLVQWLNRAIGAAFVAFGVKLALADRG
jgi:RhtB (resistance to homoserine/threonine) family protein